MEKCKGAMLATAIGDALGWPNEPRSKNRTKKPKIVDYFVEWTRSSNNPRWHDEKILPGEYSDDTQITLSVARSIIAGDWEKFLAEKELPFWLTYERGGGSATLKAAKSYKKGLSPWQSNYTRDYFNAGGNGVTMRILPHIIATAKTPNINSMMLDIVKDALITHGHPRAFLGATCYAFALEYLLRKETILEYGELVTAVIDGQNNWGANPDINVLGNWLNIANQHHDYNFSAEWENTRTRMLRQLEFIGISLKKGLILDDTTVLTELECFGKTNGAGDVAALAAIYLASRYANNPSLGIKVPAFSFGSDTDTIASITGGLLGMLSGTAWIPTEWKTIQDYNCLVQMTELLLADNKKEATKAGVAENEMQGNGWINTPIGKMRLVDSKNVPNGKNGVVVIKKWQTALGQTLYKKDFIPNDNYSHFHQAGMQMSQQSTLSDLSTMSQQASQPTQTQIEAQETVQQTVSPPEIKAQFILDKEGITKLFDNPNFKSNMTIGKVLKIIQVLVEENDDSVAIANKLKVNKTIIDLLKLYVKY